MGDGLKIDDALLRPMLHLVAHDLRNPLAALVTNLEFAQRVGVADADPDLAEALEDSVTACDVLRRIVANFDLIAKGGDNVVALHEVAVVSVVNDVVRRCQRRASQAEMRIDVVTEATPHAQLDKTLLALAVENLVANSIQHAPRKSRVEVLVTEAEGRATIAVRDGGAPVEENLRDLALDPAGHTLAGRRDGTRYGRGLGLLAARAAAEGFGGRLIATNHDELSSLELSFPSIVRATE